MSKGRYEIIPDDEEKKPLKRYEIINEENNNTQSTAKNPEMIDTFLGKMQKNNPEFKPGTPENKEKVEELINTLGPGSSGIIGAGRLAGKVGNTVKTAMSDLAPATEAAEKAGTEAAMSEKEAQVPKQGLYQKPTTELENIENEIGKHINIEAKHDVNAAPAITNRVKSVEDYWSDAYEQFEQKVADAKFQMPEEAMTNLKYDPAQIMQKLREGANPKTVVKDIEAERLSQENPYFKQLMEHAPTSKDVSAKDFLAKHRDFRDALNGLKQDFKSEHVLSAEKLKIKQAIDQGKEVQNQIKETLNQGLGKYKPEFDWINKGYAEQVFPLRKNPIVKAAKQGKLPKNMMEALRTNESGMPMVREIVKNDPELLKNVVGQRYKANPAEIHHPDALTREYVDEMPELKKLLQQKESIMQKTAARKDISLKEKVRLENELSDLKKAKKKAQGKLKMGAAAIGAAGGSYLGIPYLFNKGAKLLTGD
jgi:hypothetical protein